MLLGRWQVGRQRRTDHLSLKFIQETLALLFQLITVGQLLGG
jgi:hypothetical protein